MANTRAASHDGENDESSRRALTNSGVPSPQEAEVAADVAAVVSVAGAEVPAEIVAAADAAVAAVADGSPGVRVASANASSTPAGQGLADILVLLAVVVLGLAVVEAVLLQATREPLLGVATAAAGATIAWLYGVARPFATSGRLAPAVLACTGGLVGLSLVVALALPEATAIVAALPLVAVAVALPFSDRRTLLIVMVTAWTTEVLLAIASELIPGSGAFPPALLSVLRVAGVTAGIALVLLFLWQFASHFGDALARMAAGTIALRSAEARIGEVNEELLRRVDELEIRSRETAQLTKLGDLLQSCETSEEAYSVITQAAGPLYAGDSGVLYELSGSRTVVEQVAAWGENSSSLSVFAPSECWALRRGRPYLVEDPSSDLLCPHVADVIPAGYVCVPLSAQSETLGMLHVEIGYKVPRNRRAARLAERQRLTVTLSENLSLALANFRLRATLRERSTRDELTGLFNRRYMEDSLDREIRRAMRDGHALGILMVDLDHFKRLNDAFGHAAGDFALRQVGQFLQAAIRAEDIACRFGGEEFVVILPKATIADTQRRAEALRLGARELRPEHGAPAFPTVTMSIGVAAFPEHGSTGEALLHAADEALYRAKAAGRDRVVVAGLRDGTALPIGPE